MEFLLYQFLCNCRFRRAIDTGIQLAENWKFLRQKMHMGILRKHDDVRNQDYIIYYPEKLNAHWVDPCQSLSSKLVVSQPRKSVPWIQEKMSYFLTEETRINVKRKKVGYSYFL